MTLNLPPWPFANCNSAEVGGWRGGPADTVCSVGVLPLKACMCHALQCLCVLSVAFPFRLSCVAFLPSLEPGVLMRLAAGCTCLFAGRLAGERKRPKPKRPRRPQ